MRYLIALIAAVVGGMAGGVDGFVITGVVALGVVMWLQHGEFVDLRNRVDTLSKRLATAAPQEPGDNVETALEPVAPEAPTPEAPPPSPPPTYEPGAFETAIDRAVAAVKRFFTTGNVVVRIGAVVLFFGIAFLLRYAYENALLPLELRLGGSALGGVALVAVGWRLRHRADTYGLVLQGAGVGVLYLTIFAAARLYDLLPLSAAFVMLVALVAASSILAVLQSSQALAIFSMSGGFLAPVLTSTGEGSHIALFSYYALLNAGIFAMAWFRQWRWLNWVGFLFTFVIGAMWGNDYYRSELFATTEPFLLLFFFFYVGVSVLFARKLGVNLRGIVDGTLVFGVPIVAFALQAQLVEHTQFGLAFSALGAAAVYVLLVLWLRSMGAFALLLAPSFIALGVGFATLAIPFAFDDQRFTAASWALEGAGLVWVGLRQQQLLPRLAGLLLQTAAGVAFVWELGTDVGPSYFLNSAYLGAAMLAIAGGFSAYQLSIAATVSNRWERWLAWVYLAWGVLWWFVGGAREIFRFEPWWLERSTPNDVNVHLFVAFAALSTAGFVVLARRFDWRAMLMPGFLLLPLLVLVALILAIDAHQSGPLAHLGWLAWPAGVAALLIHLEAAEGIRLDALWHAGTWWLTTMLIAWAAADAVANTDVGAVWSDVLWGAVPAAALVIALRTRALTVWPFATHHGSYSGWGAVPVASYLLLWVLMIGATPGDPTPLPYLPVANPIDLVSVMALFVVFSWARPFVAASLATVLNLLIGGVAFLWLNLAAARAVHFWGGVSYPLDQVVGSDTFQTTATILWTVTALVLMGVGTRLKMRTSWIAGASLLGLVIVKLFTLDLGNLDVVARIVSFLTVGVLMLVIGYFAPLPPRPGEDQHREGAAAA